VLFLQAAGTLDFIDVIQLFILSNRWITVVEIVNRDLELARIPSALS